MEGYNLCSDCSLGKSVLESESIDLDISIKKNEKMVLAGSRAK